MYVTEKNDPSIIIAVGAFAVSWLVLFGFSIGFCVTKAKLRKVSLN